MACHLVSALKSSVSGMALSAGLCVAALPAFALPSHNTPTLAAGVKDLGAPEPGHEMKLTVMLKLHDEAKLDAVMDQLYDPSSKLYRKWLTPADLAAYAPTAAELGAVKAELISHGFSVLSIDPQRFSLRVRGTVATTEQAFQTTLHRYTHNNQTFVVHTRDAQLTGAAGALVASVAGLDQHAVHPMLTMAKDPKTGQKLFLGNATTTTAGGIRSRISNIPLSPVVSQTVTDGTGSTATFTGSTYEPKGLPIASTPQQLQAYYGMNALYKLGYTGKGQSIALLEGYGYDTAGKDGNKFSAIFHLTPFNAKTFKTFYPGGRPADPNATYVLGWATEIALDVDAAHSLAPDAEIDIVASNGQDVEDMIFSIQYIINKGVSHVISGSFENDTDIDASQTEVDAYNTVLKLGAAQGFAFQFSTGDSGDNGVGSPVGSAGLPSESPYATAIGGTSILNDPNDDTHFYPVGWGTTGSYLYTGTIFNPLSGFFVAGSGGGRSVHNKKPKWQSTLPGDYRLTPDVSALADPYTGALYVETSQGGVQQIGVVGGTSLACPLISAMWAIAGQYAGHPLGQAAPAISRLTSAEITDVKPLALFKPTSVTDTITDSSGKVTTFDDLGVFGSAVPRGQHGVASAFFRDSGGNYVTLGFGIDSSLSNTPGWDDSTGYGEPNGFPFITGVAK